MSYYRFFFWYHKAALGYKIYAIYWSITEYVDVIWNSRFSWMEGINEDITLQPLHKCKYNYWCGFRRYRGSTKILWNYNIMKSALNDVDISLKPWHLVQLEKYDKIISWKFIRRASIDMNSILKTEKLEMLRSLNSNKIKVSMRMIIEDITGIQYFSERIFQLFHGKKIQGCFPLEPVLFSDMCQNIYVE